MTNTDITQDEADIITQALGLGVLNTLLKRLNEMGYDWDYNTLAKKVDKITEKLER